MNKNLSNNGAILVLSGPSGAGKSTIINKASSKIGEYYFSISTTTREPREGETHGVEYYFVTKQAFEDDIKAGNFLEYAKVHDNYYGTSLVPVEEALNAGKLVIFDIDVQGHKLVREAMNDLVTSIFITPPSIEVLDARLRARSSDSDDVIKKRVQNAKDEIKEAYAYDFVIINDDIEIASSQFVDIARACRSKMNKKELENLVLLWQK